MNSRIPLALLLVLALLPAVLRPASGAAPTAAPGQEIVVVLKDGTNPAAVARDAGVEPQRLFRHVFAGFTARVPARAVEALRRNPQVDIVSENYPVVADALVLPTGVDRIDADQYPQAAIGGDSGPSVDADVAVLDTGISPSHTDLNVAGGVNFVGSGDTGCAATEAWADDRGHGTAVAGVIGARDNGEGVVGVAPGARLWAVKVLDQNNRGTFATVICGLDWVVANKGTIDVVNLSLGWSPVPDGPCGSDALHEAICRVVNDAGIPIVVSAGNNGTDTASQAPATYAETIAVSAFADYDGRPGGAGSLPQLCNASGLPGGPDDRFASFSNDGPDVDLAAPGQALQTTDVRGGWTECWYGTSFAAPHVAGAAALYKAGNPAATPGQVRTWLLETASQPQGSAAGFGGDGDGSPEPVLTLGEGSAPNAAPPNAAPVAVADRLTVQAGKSGRRALLANDSDPDGDALAARRVTSPRHGTARVTSAGALVYEADRDFVGQDAFVYEVRDPKGSTDRARVVVKVTR